MLLENKNAVIYGGGGAIGGAIARAFAQEGARVYLAGRTLTRLEEVAAAMVSAWGRSPPRASNAGPKTGEKDEICRS
jgi:3-oxoacyl-[acyl-carrier protein] reductase